ncbi:MAG: MarR family transcriptional regulator [Phycisphaerae bacterium]
MDPSLTPLLARPIEEDIAAAVRSIVRAVDRQSRWLVEEHGLTSPQAATLRAALRLDSASAGDLARAVRLSQPTVTGILDRLERRGLISRNRDPRDRRSILIRVTPEGIQALHAVPSPLHERFRRELSRLEDWEQTMILATLQRVARMMGADHATSPETPAIEPQSPCPSGEQPAPRAEVGG